MATNPELMNQADRILRPVLVKLADIPWLNVTACCAGHRAEDSVWFETEIHGASGLRNLMEWLRVLEGKLDGTGCRTDCLFSYSHSVDAEEGEEGEPEQDPPDYVDSDDTADFRTPHGWFPVVLETFWPADDDWRRGQSLIIEALLSSVEDFDAEGEEAPATGALNFCPFCSSSFIRLDTIETAGHRYVCGDCEMAWTMIDPTL